MTAGEIIEELKRLGTESVKKVLRNHGAREPLLGVKIEDLKKIQKRIKTDYQLALDLYDTGIYDAIKRLLQRVQKSIHQQPDFVRYAMNGFVIALGSYVQPLSDDALRAAEKIGPVSVDMGNTACQVPDAVEYIQKVREREAIGRKRKTAKC